VLANTVAITLEASHATEAIEQAFARFGAPDIVNTAQGSQFTAEDVTDAVLQRYENRQRQRSIVVLKLRATALCFQINPTPVTA